MPLISWLNPKPEVSRRDYLCFQPPNWWQCPLRESSSENPTIPPALPTGSGRRFLFRAHPRVNPNSLPGKGRAGKSVTLRRLIQSNGLLRGDRKDDPDFLEHGLSSGSPHHEKHKPPRSVGMKRGGLESLSRRSGCQRSCRLTTYPSSARVWTMILASERWAQVMALFLARDRSCLDFFSGNLGRGDHADTVSAIRVVRGSGSARLR